MESGALLFLLAAAFAGGVANGLVGFGAGIVAMVLWLYVIDPVVAVPLMGACALCAQLLTLRVVWRILDWQRLKILLPAAMLGVPTGALLLTRIDPQHFRVLLGFALAGYSAWRLLSRWRRKRAPRQSGQATAAAVGFVSGFFGGFAGSTAPTVVLWATAQGWDKHEQRAVYQPLMLIVAVTMLTSYAFQGLLTREVGMLALYAAPIMLTGTFVGVALYRRISDVQFETVILLLILVSGITLGVRSL